MKRLVPALVLVSTMLARVAAAETADKMFREAKKAMDAGDYPRACPLFEESQRLDPGGGTLLNLALCQEKLGKIATAKKTFEEAAARAREGGRADRLGEASSHIAALEPKVPTLVLVSARPLAQLGKVTIDGRAVHADELNARLPLDPGTHAVRVDGDPGREVYTVDLKEGESTRLSLDGKPPDLAPTPPPARVEERPAPVFRPPPPALEVPAHRPEASFSAASWTAFGVAGAGGGVALVTGLMALSARSDYAEKCFDDRGYCTDASARDSGDRARSLAWVSTVSLGVGVVALWTGLLLPRKYPVTVSAEGAGVAVRGAF